MTSLHELQSRFAISLFSDCSDTVMPLLIEGEEDENSFAIYRNNLRVGFQRTLAVEFPVIERLVGSDYFAQLAFDFLQKFPSRSGDQHHVGAPFASFLESRFEDTAYRYLSHVARLEWARQEVMIAAEIPPLYPSALNDVPATEYARLRFSMRPSCRLVETSYPVVSIWRTNQDELDSNPIDLGSTQDLVLVHRMEEWVKLTCLSRPDFALLKALSTGVALGEAIEAAFSIDPSFNLGEALQRFFSWGVFGQHDAGRDDREEFPK